MKPSESEHPGVFTFHDLSYILCNRMEIFGTEKKCSYFGGVHFRGFTVCTALVTGLFDLNHKGREFKL